jgi:ubiquinone/menaquinone biosynthesis C-methylase UbiE
VSSWIFKRLETKPINLRTNNLVLKSEANSTANVFDEMGVYWAEIADQSQTEKQLQFLKDHLKPDGYVLDVACGTGRHMIPLSLHGYGIVGLDASEKLLRIAKKRSKEIMVIRGDMRFLPFKPQTFTAAISMDTSFGYLPSDADDRVSLAEIHRALTQGGIFVIDVFNRQEYIHEYKDKNPSSKWREYHSFFLQQKRTISPNGDWLCDLWTIQDRASGRLSTFEHAVRLYEHKDLDSMLKKTGFEVKGVFGGYEGKNFSSESRRLILVAFAK